MMFVFMHCNKKRGAWPLKHAFILQSMKTIDWIFIFVGKTFCHVIHVLKEGLGPSKYPATNIY